MQNITREAIEMADEKQVLKVNNFDVKNYLNVKLKPGELSKELTIRLLPIDKDSNTPFKKIKMHPIKIEGVGWKNYVCLSKTEDIDHDKFGHKCPFCELNQKAYNASLEEKDPIEKRRWQRISLDNIPNDVVVVRCIERGAEEDGPKFWKFNLHKKKDDPYHVMLDLYNTRKKEDEDDGIENPINIFDIYEGKDLIVKITAELDEQGKPTGKTSVTIKDKSRVTPLSTSKEQMEKWINDPKTWRDVFVAKPYEYLSIIINGKVPYFDREQNKWVERIESNDENDQQELISKEIEEDFEKAMSVSKPTIDNNDIF